MKNWLYICLIFCFIAGAQEAEIKNTDSKEAQEQWVYAEGLFSRTWYGDAIKEYLLFVEKHPSSVNSQAARWRLYECYVKLGKDKEVLEALDQFIEHEPDLIRKERARMNKAKLLFDAKDFDGALKLYEQINKKLDKGQLWESARYEAARIFLKKGQQGEAFLRFRKLSSLNYKGKSAIRSYAIFAYASLLTEKRQFAEAIKQYLRLTSVKETPAELAENSWYNLGALYFRKNKFAEAGEAFNFLIKNYPEGRFKENSVNQAARCYIQLGKLLEAGQVLGKVATATGAIALERDYLKAYSLRLLKEYDKAAILFDVCVNAESDTFREEAWFNKVSCLSEGGHSQKAFDESLSFLKIYPETPHLADVYYLMGIEAEKLRQRVEAEKYFRLALKSYVGEWVLVDNAYFALARILAASGAYEKEAEVWAELSERRRSEYRGTAMLKGAEAWLQAKNTAKALTLLTMYTKAFPEGKDAYYVKNRIVEIHILDRNYKDAVSFLTDIIDHKGLKPEEKAGLQSVLGRVLYYQKDYQASVKVLDICLKEADLSLAIKTDCMVYQGFSLISLKQEAKGVKILSQAFLQRDDFSALIKVAEENEIALLLEKYNYNKAAFKIYSRLSASTIKETKIIGLMGLARLESNTKEPQKGLIHLQKILELCTDENQLERVGALSIMGEIYLFQGKEDQALRTFESALKVKAGNEASICRSLFGMASILKSRKDYTKAKRYANKVFILYKDPVYCPRAMFLSLSTSVLLSMKKEAAQTAIELKKKFPLYFAKIEVQDYLKENGIKTD